LGEALGYTQNERASYFSTVCGGFVSASKGVNSHNQTANECSKKLGC